MCEFGYRFPLLTYSLMPSATATPAQQTIDSPVYSSVLRGAAQLKQTPIPREIITSDMPQIRAAKDSLAAKPAWNLRGRIGSNLSAHGDAVPCTSEGGSRKKIPARQPDPQARRPAVRLIGKSSRSTVCGVARPPKARDFYVGRVSRDCNAQQLIDYLKKNQIEVMMCEEIELKHEYFRAFHIKVEKEPYEERFWDPDLWSADLVVRRWMVAPTRR